MVDQACEDSARMSERSVSKQFCLCQSTAPEYRMIRTFASQSRSCLPGLARVALAVTGLLAGSALFPTHLSGQSQKTDPVAFLVQDGLRYTEERRYSEAINVLEDAWERDPSNPIVAEHLALAHLYERIPPTTETLKKAQDLMRFSLAHGGQVTVLAQHLHRGLRWAISPDDHCSGRLVLSKSGLHYRTSLTEHSSSLSSNQLESITLAKGKKTSSASVLTLRVEGGKHHLIRTGTLSRSEAQIVFELIHEFLL